MSDLETFGSHARMMSAAEHKTDRALWKRLADEVDAYLSTDAEEGLFA